MSGLQRRGSRHPSGNLEPGGPCRLLDASEVTPDVARKAWGITPDRYGQLLRREGTVGVPGGVVLRQQLQAHGTWIDEEYDHGFMSMGEAEILRRWVRRGRRRCRDAPRHSSRRRLDLAPQPRSSTPPSPASPPCLRSLMPLRTELEADRAEGLAATKALLGRLKTLLHAGRRGDAEEELEAAKAAGLQRLAGLLDKIDGALGGEEAVAEGLHCTLLHQWRQRILPGLWEQRPGTPMVYWEHLAWNQVRGAAGCGRNPEGGGVCSHGSHAAGW